MAGSRTLSIAARARDGAGGPHGVTVDSDDTELAAMMVLGSTRAFDLLYLRHAATVRRLGVSMLHNRDAADDLVQDTFLQLWRDRGRYSAERASVRTWTLAIARNRALDLVRAQARHARLVDASRGLARTAVALPDQLVATIARDEVAQLHAMLADLPAVQRRAIVLVYGGGLTHREVAQRTGVPLGTVKGRIRLGQLSIARRLEPGRRVELPASA